MSLHEEHEVERHEMIEAIIDKAVPHQEGNTVLLDLEGWAFAGQGHILVAQALGNGESLGYIPYGFRRTDVKSHFKSRCSSECVGFQGQVKLPDTLANLDSLELKIVFTTSELLRREITASLPLKEMLSGSTAAAYPDAVHAIDTVSPGDQSQSDSPVTLAAPNFFILGAGKCGTTSLHHALKQHPEIHLTHIKEPSFLSTGYQVVRNPIEYFHLFPKAEEKKRYGEASHIYFSTPETAPVLRQLFPDAKFLLIVRDPVQRALSLYEHMRREGLEPIPTFELALKEEDLRFTDPHFKKTCPQYFGNYMYCRSSRYDLQLENYLKVFPLSQFLILTLGEWKSDPVFWQKEIFKFLEVDSSVTVGTEPQNQAETSAILREKTRIALQEKFSGVRERLESMIGRQLQNWDY